MLSLKKDACCIPTFFGITHKRAGELEALLDEVIQPVVKIVHHEAEGTVDQRQFMADLLAIAKDEKEEAFIAYHAGRIVSDLLEEDEDDEPEVSVRNIAPNIKVITIKA